MKRLVFRGTVELEEGLLPPVPPRHILVRVVAAAWTSLERGIAAGYVWLEHGRVVGHTGFGVVVKRGANVDIPEGSLVVQDSTTPNGLQPGLHIDGWLAEYTVVPASAVRVLDRSACSKREAFCALLYPMGLGVAAVEEARGSFAILGCGVSGLAAALYAKSLGLRAQLYCASRASVELASKLGLEARSVEKVERVEADTVYLSGIDASLVMLAERSVHTHTLLHPVYSYWPPPRIRSGEVRVIALSWIDRVLKDREVFEPLTRLVGEASLEGVPSMRDRLAYVVRLSTQ